MSVVLTVYEVMAIGHPLWIEIAGDLLTGLFVVELVLRFWVARKKRRFFERYWLDILAVLPLVRPLRLFRTLRVLRLFRAGVLLRRRMSRTELSRGGEVLALVIGTTLLVLMSAMVLQVTEGRENDKLDEFDEVLWYSAYSLVGGEPIHARRRRTSGGG